MGSGKNKNSKINKKEDGKFHSKKIKHDPVAESARAMAGLNQNENFHDEKSK